MRKEHDPKNFGVAGKKQRLVSNHNTFDHTGRPVHTIGKDWHTFLFSLLSLLSLSLLSLLSLLYLYYLYYLCAVGSRCRGDSSITYRPSFSRNEVEYLRRIYSHMDESDTMQGLMSLRAHIRTKKGKHQEKNKTQSSVDDDVVDLTGSDTTTTTPTTTTHTTTTDHRNYLTSYYHITNFTIFY